MKRLQAGLAGRAAWTFSSQTISSTSNFVLTVSVLSLASERDFATFSVGYATYLLFVQLARSLSGLPLLILHTGLREGSGNEGHRRALGVALGVGVLASLVLVVAGVLIDRGKGQFVVLAALMPLLLFQDSLRHFAFASGRPREAAVSDGLWLVLQMAGLVLVIFVWHSSALGVLGAWAAAGSISGLVVGIRLGVYPTLAGGLEWLRANAALCRRLLLEFLLTSGSYYGLLFGLALIAGVGELGRLRAAQTLLGPVIVVLLGGNSLGVPESVRIRADLRQLKRFVLWLSSFLAAVSLIWGVLVFMLLPIFGPQVFPDNWDLARPLIPLMAVFAASIGASSGPSSALRALGENSWILKARGASGVVALVTGLTAAAFVGAQAVVGALALSECLFAGRAIAYLRKPSKITPHPIEGLETYVPT